MVPYRDDVVSGRTGLLELILIPGGLICSGALSVFVVGFGSS